MFSVVDRVVADSFLNGCLSIFFRAVYDMSTGRELKNKQVFNISHNLSRKSNGIRYPYSLVKQQILTRAQQ